MYDGLVTADEGVVSRGLVVIVTVLAEACILEGWCWL